MNKEAIIQLEYHLLEAIKKSDLTFLDHILHDDLLFMIPNGSIITKAMDMDSHRAGDMKVDELIPNIETVKIIKDTAIVIVVYETKGSMMGQAIEGKFRYIRVWKKFNHDIKIIGGSCSQIA